MSPVDLCVVIPVYQGAPFLRALCERLSRMVSICQLTGSPIAIRECYFVIDGAKDQSLSILTELKQTYPWIRILTLSRNFGQHPATIAGILHTSSDWIVTMDEDLQHPPEAILKMLLQAVDHHSDLLYARPLKNVHRSKYRDFCSKTAKALTARLAGIPCIVHFNSFRVVRGSIARAAAASCSSETYYDVALTWYTQAIETFPILLEDQRIQQTAMSSYTFSRLLKHAGRLLLTADSRVLRFGSRLGVLGFFFAFLLITAIFATKLLLPEWIPVQGWASTITLML